MKIIDDEKRNKSSKFEGDHKSKYNQYNADIVEVT